MGKRITIDPIPRIEGHLRIEVEVTGGKVTDAWSSGMLFRGLEIILQGRDPRDAPLITQRACGVCTYVHMASSVKCIDDAVKIKIPTNARIIRNLMMAAQHIHDHQVHFYHLHALDWVDIVSAVKADPKKTADLANAHSNAPGQGTKDFAAVRDKLKAFVDSGQLGPFANAYWGHPAYKLPPEANLMASKHYLDALKNQVKAAQLHAIFGGKNPHLQTAVPGGVTCGNYLNADRIAQFKYMLLEQIDFIKNVYIPDVLAVALFYKDWAAIGGTTNFLAWGEFPGEGEEPKNLFQPRGWIKNRELKHRMADPAKVTEEVSRSWYKDSQPVHPYNGVTEPMENAPLKTDGQLDEKGKYTWLKAPRYEGVPCEVGPLARTLVSYTAGQPETKKYVDYVLKTLGVGPEALFSTLGRTAGRAINCLVIAEQALTWVDDLVANLKKGDAKSYENWEFPAGEAQGVGLTDVPRGALGHWIKMKDGKISNYQMVVPSTWNLGPRDAKGQKGPVEESLIGTPIADPKQPLEVLRTVHSFDPCIACAVHVIDPESNEVHKVRAV
ncbi:MAG: nickel-dependent hydrogenase large subunit [Proteobacteria bacterium]|nr:nickel-dependent hydrogenase large subunit [Pseudomonadota bacterium]